MTTPGNLDKGADTEVSAPEFFNRSDPPVMSLTLWPHRSLSRTGFGVVMLITTVGLVGPLASFVGTSAMWGIFPFLLVAPVALYTALRRNYADGRLTEELRLWPDLITVERREARGQVRRWHANPFWVEVQLFRTGRIENYLTLTGNGREVELGAFLSPPERAEIYRELTSAIRSVRRG